MGHINLLFHGNQKWISNGKKMTVNPTLLVLQVSSYECNQGPQLTCAKENQDGVSGPTCYVRLHKKLITSICNSISKSDLKLTLAPSKAETSRNSQWLKSLIWKSISLNWLVYVEVHFINKLVPILVTTPISKILMFVSCEPTTTTFKTAFCKGCAP